MKILAIIILLGLSIYGDDKIYKEQDWGIALSIRTGTIPYDTSPLDAKKTVSSFVPMLFFENEYFFLRGLESGIKLYKSQDLNFNLLTRQRYINIPIELQNEIQADTNDIGAQVQYNLTKNQSLDFEIMSDLSGRFYSNIKYDFEAETTSLDYKLYAKLQLNSKDYNTYYYGFNDESVKQDIATSLGASAKYHVASNFYILGSFQSTLIGKEARKSSKVNTNIENELYLGIGVFNDKTKAKKQKLGISPYIRVAHGWTTPSNIGEIINFDAEKDPNNNQMTSLFLGYPLTDNIFSFPIDIYLTPGFVWHYSSAVQSSTQEYIIAIKAYYTIPLPWRVRFGMAEGVSYAKEVTFVEANEMQAKGYEPSNLLNYLDFSLDVSLGDIFSNDLNQWWLGYSIHHRSAIFESSSRFGRIKGGLNIQTVYIQWHI